MSMSRDGGKQKSSHAFSFAATTWPPRVLLLMYAGLMCAGLAEVGIRKSPWLCLDMGFGSRGNDFTVWPALWECRVCYVAAWIYDKCYSFGQAQLFDCEISLYAHALVTNS